MKIMTYNILEGAESDGSSRIHHIIDIINQEKPDVLAIQEADRFHENDFLKKISKQTGLLHFAISKSRLCHVVVLSRFPFKNTHTFPDDGFNHAALCVLIDSPFGEMSVCCVHLNSTLEDERLREAKIVLEYQEQFKNSIILGDFNAVSSVNQQGKDLSGNEFVHYGLTRFDVNDLFNKHYSDAAVALKVDDITTHPTIGVGHPISKTPVRLDYIFVTASLTAYLKELRVIKTAISEIASDHYPVTLVLQ